MRPGRTTLRDLLTAAREGALQHAFALLARGLTAEQREQLDALLVVPSGGDVETQAGVVAAGSTHRHPRARLSEDARHRGDPPGHPPAFGQLGLPLRGLEPPALCAR